MATEIAVSTSFTGTPTTGTTPISATFAADVVFSNPTTQSTYTVSAYHWCFDNSATPKVIETTTEPTTTHIFYGLYGQAFDVSLSAGITPAPDELLGLTTATSASYVTLGGVDQIKYSKNKELDLIRFLPGTFLETETEIFTQFFEDYLNTMFEGTEGIVLSATDLVISPQ